MCTIMARRSKIEATEDGSITARVTLQPATGQLVRRYAEKLSLNVEDAVRVFLAQIEALIDCKSLTWLSADWRALAQQAPEAARPAIDVSRLHRNTRVKSGYHGVYVNGSGFRATGRQGEYIATCSTADEAAWRRYQHYVQHGYPYGELELEIDRLRRDGEAGTDQELRKIALETARDTNTLHLYKQHMTADELAFYGGASGEPTLQMAGFGAGEFEAAQAALNTRDTQEDR